MTLSEGYKNCLIIYFFASLFNEFHCIIDILYKYKIQIYFYDQF